jgi:4-amino-4-deoxy-L-arabinose transferase-like glycosyltransferase
MPSASQILRASVIDAGIAQSSLRSSRALMLGIILVCATTLWFAVLGGRSLYDPDEGRYAEISREMLQSSEWVTPHLNGLVYLEKPPLQYWLTALSFRYFGETETAARLCTGLAGYLSLAIVFFLGRRLWGDAAGLKAVLLTGASALFVLLGHQATLDMLLNLWMLACLACLLMAQAERDDRARCRTWMLGCWLAMALAVLTKGLIGAVVPAATLLLYALWQRDRRVLEGLNIRWGLPLFAVVSAPWFVLAARANPQFLRFFFIREHIQRFLTPIEHRSAPWWFFIVVIAAGILPWFPLALRTFALSWRGGAPRGQFDPSRLLWVWSAFVFVFFSLSDSKLIPYVLPIVPTLALLCAGRPAGDERFSLAAGSLLSLAASAGIIVYGNVAWHSPPGEALAIPLAMHRQPGLVWTAGLFAAAAVLCLALLLNKRTQAALAALCVGWFLGSFGLLIAATEAQQFFSAKALAVELKNTAEVSSPVYSVQVYDQSLPFYLQRPVVLVDYRDEFAPGLDQDPTRGIGDLREFADRWRELQDGYAVMRPSTRDSLEALGLPMRELARAPNRVLMSRR